MCQYVIELTGLTKKYGNFTAVNDLNLQIRKGEIFGLLGPNGAGKSTTILMMLGLTEPTTGSVKVCNIDSTTHPIDVKRKVGYLPEDVGFYEDMTGIENLIYTAALNGIRKKEARAKAEQLLDRVGLLKEADKKAGKYSGRCAGIYGSDPATEPGRGIDRLVFFPSSEPGPASLRPGRIVWRGKAVGGDRTDRFA